MLKNLKRFWNEESGMGTVELIIIIGILVAIALVFRKAIMSFVSDLIKKFFDPDAIPSVSEPA
jgi:Flp pilus assembly pilin Flp